LPLEFSFVSHLENRMPGRPIPNEPELLRAGYGHPDFVRRRAVLRETLDAFASAEPRDKYQLLAAANLRDWRSARAQDAMVGQVRVLAGDWGEVTLALSRAYGACFAVLNMANAWVPGGAYVEGAPAQEENMFRRTDCHFHVDENEYDSVRGCYFPDMTRLISAENGRVYLDSENPRICIRGPEDRLKADLGYRWLPDEDVFPFYELRAAAQDLRDGSVFNMDEARRRIAAQLDSLREHDIRHAVLGASGCGAFMNPAREVARIYKEEINSRSADFALIAFAIFSAGYGPGNYEPFAEVFQD
jgi:hypothetical protein